MILLLIIQLMHQIKEKLRENMAKVTRSKSNARKIVNKYTEN